MSETDAPRLGRTPGMRPVHAVVAAVLVLAWVGVLAFVLTDGKGTGPGVDVYSELPPGFTASLQTEGVTFAGLSPVDGATVQQVLTRATGEVSASSGTDPIVLRTSFTDHHGGADFTDRAALMVVVANPRAARASAGGGAGSPVFVAFVDPTTYTTLTSVEYDAAGAAG